MTARPPVGSCISLDKSDLQKMIERLATLGYHVVGPQVADGAVIYDELIDANQLPWGVLDEQDGGRYRLRKSEDAGAFDHVVGPHSLKQYLFPPTETIQELTRNNDAWQVETPGQEPPPLAVIGVRSCDLHALAVQDKVFLEGPYVDPGYQARRERLLLISVQCRRAAATCFCHSMQTGPRAKAGFDLALTELENRFVIEVGTAKGADVMRGVEGWQSSSTKEVDAALEQSAELLQHLKLRGRESLGTDQPAPRKLETHDVHDLLLENLDHPRWQQVAERCLSCANCTLVCPTCFCSTVEEVADLTGDHVRRERTWSSCFTAEHSRMNSGEVRNTTAARYRQWLTHKLATWIDQYGVSGCVGCGRCITWCPVGIDLTEEVAAIREQTV